MPEEKPARYDSADDIKTEEDVAAYLEAVMKEGAMIPPISPVPSRWLARPRELL